jgi:hypothetical protein
MTSGAPLPGRRPAMRVYLDVLTLLAALANLAITLCGKVH